ncbi:MAG: glyoxalase [Cytophagaceae bacterium]|nr:MAG: glyoxalase [Cytophagaceae bacterium]
MAKSSSIVPGLRYSDPDAAITFMKTAFGFVENAVFRDDAGKVMHAQMVLGTGMVMLGPDDSPDMKEQFATPRKNGGVSTQAVYVVVDDADEHHRIAAAAGAKILKEVKDAEYGGRGYTCSDIDGHVWEFGTYNPWRD